MRDTKFTTGEWVTENVSDVLRVTAGKKGFVIAEVTNKQISHFIGNEEEAQANAKLIAASPELFKALGHIIERLETVIVSDETKGTRLCAFAESLCGIGKEAIKKATK